MCYSAEKQEFTHASFVDNKCIETFIEDIRCLASDEGGESADGYLDEILESEEHLKNIKNMILEYLNDHATNPAFWCPENIKGIPLLVTRNVGEGNSDWNFSAPHGAGRRFSRGKAKELISLEEFQASMTHVFSTSVIKSRVDESAMAYKEIGDILPHITPTVKILKHLKPLYNFKG